MVSYYDNGIERQTVNIIVKKNISLFLLLLFGWLLLLLLRHDTAITNNLLKSFPLTQKVIIIINSTLLTPRHKWQIQNKGLLKYITIWLLYSFQRRLHRSFVNRNKRLFHHCLNSYCPEHVLFYADLTLMQMQFLPASNITFDTLMLTTT